MTRLGSYWAVSGVFLASLVLQTGAQAQESNYPDDPESLAIGRKIAEDNCSPCHAVGAEGESPDPQAPAFRDLSQRYPVSSLEESLAEGIVTGHNDMPEFVLQPDDIERFLGYLSSIQVQKDKN
ncbi:c-type cytochrome [Roseibium litorale]|uniref:Cytochrome c n=1 Tax=Roseibium litorale TaxID=2803841 RepID=A0ABR9CHJ7_9HYPH|nr:cytochrome c [Roseibium litorale]MBD8890317.1 cytochrome c [Roseibium litorale]